MKSYLVFYIALYASLAASKETEPELPLCPTDIQYFPQNLPMHCRMPANANVPSLRGGQQKANTAPPFIPPYYQSPPPDKNMPPVPLPFPGVPGAPPMPMMPLPPPPSHKLPVIVMPFYSPDPAYKKRKPRGPKPFYDTETSYERRKKHRDGHTRRPHTDSDCSDTDSDTDSSDSSTDSSSAEGFWKSNRGFRKNARRSNRRHRSRRRKHGRKEKELLTPILQYVSKDGYVVFEKKISKGEAKQWLGGDEKRGRRESIESENKKKHGKVPEEMEEYRYLTEKDTRKDPDMITEQPSASELMPRKNPLYSRLQKRVSSRPRSQPSASR